MKKNYFLVATFLLATFAINAQVINDDLESYPLGDIGDANPTVWSSWSGDPTDGANLEISDFYSVSGVQSGLIGPGSVQDCLLLLGDLTTGVYTLQWEMYIPTGRTGYINIQGQTEAGGAGNGGNGVFNSSNIYYNQANGNPGVLFDELTSETGSFNHDEWFTMRIEFDLDGGPNYQMYLNDVAVNAAPVPFNTDSVLGGIDFFSIDADNEYYLDDVVFTDANASIDDFASKGFSAFPNPVQNELTIQAKEAISSVAVYNVLGQQVYAAQVDALSSTIDMSQMASGAYFVKVDIAGTEGTVKVIR